jgi:glycosyltransferase involved in cell wall biosynthesis
VRVEVVCASREVFGADRSAVRLGAVLASLGADVSLTVPSQRPELGLEELARQHGLATTPGPVVVASSRGVSGVTTRTPRQPASDLTIYNSAAVALLRGDRRPRVLVLREWLYPRRLRHRALVALHRRRIDRVVAISNGVAERWRGGERPAVEVIPNWLEDSWLSGNPNTHREGVLFVGRLNAWKGQLLLADAYVRAFGHGSRPALTFLGAEGPGSPFHGRAVELGRRCEGVGARILDLTADPRPVISRAALVVVPSLRPEPFGNVVLEALACGARVIAFPGGGIDDLAPAFHGALEVVDRSLDGLAGALARWWSAGGPAQDAAVHAATRETLRQRFSATAVAPRWKLMLDRLIGPESRPAQRTAAA